MLQHHARQPNYCARAILQSDPDTRKFQIAFGVFAEGDQKVVPMMRRIAVPVCLRVSVGDDRNAIEYRSPFADDILALDPRIFSQAIECLPTSVVKGRMDDREDR